MARTPFTQELLHQIFDDTGTMSLELIAERLPDWSEKTSSLGWQLGGIEITLITPWQTVKLIPLKLSITEKPYPKKFPQEDNLSLKSISSKYRQRLKLLINRLLATPIV